MPTLEQQISTYTQAKLDKSAEDYAQIVARNIRALRKLTDTTGSKTTRTINDILQSLPGPILTRVAVLLDGEGQ